MKKILLVIDNLGSGGAQNQLTLLAVGLKKRGYDMTVFTYYPDNFFEYRLSENNVPLVNVQKKDKIGINVIWGLKKYIDINNVDTVITFMRGSNFYGSIVKKIARKSFKLIISYRSKTDFENFPSTEIKRLKWVNKIADAIVANSHHERERWQNKQPKLAYKWHTIYNAVDFLKFHPLDDNIKKDYFLIVGSISQHKNGLVVIEALRLLVKTNPNIHILWVGEKNIHLPDRKAYLMQMESKIEEYNLVDNFTWGEPVSDIEHLYHETKALILPSITEGLPNVVCEAMSCGTPCIVSNVLDHHNLIDDRISGFLFDPKDAETLMKAMLSIDQMSSQQYSDMKKNASLKSIKLFSNEKFTSSFEQLINK
ncbi:MAG: glycosyltransferase family 4 protein [Saprospiraceae bacterium]